MCSFPECPTIDIPLNGLIELTSLTQEVSVEHQLLLKPLRERSYLPLDTLYLPFSFAWLEYSRKVAPPSGRAATTGRTGRMRGGYKSLGYFTPSKFTYKCSRAHVFANANLEHTLGNFLAQVFHFLSSRGPLHAAKRGNERIPRRILSSRAPEEREGEKMKKRVSLSHVQPFSFFPLREKTSITYTRASSKTVSEKGKKEGGQARDNTKKWKTSQGGIWRLERWTSHWRASPFFFKKDLSPHTYVCVSAIQ